MIFLLVSGLAVLLAVLRVQTMRVGEPAVIRSALVRGGLAYLAFWIVGTGILGPAGPLAIPGVERRSSSADAVRALGDRFGSVIVWGSLSLANALLNAGHVDRLRLRICPVLIGDGLRFAPPALGQRLLRLESSQALPSGHVLTEYAMGAGPATATAASAPRTHVEADPQ